MNREDLDRHTLAVAICAREASAWISTALTLLRAMGHDPQALRELTVFLADFAHDLDHTHQRAAQEDHHAPQPETE